MRARPPRQAPRPMPFIDYYAFARANLRFLAFGFLVAFTSSAGQTFFIGVFGPEVECEAMLFTPGVPHHVEHLPA